MPGTVQRLLLCYIAKCNSLDVAGTIINYAAIEPAACKRQAAPCCPACAAKRSALLVGSGGAVGGALPAHVACARCTRGGERLQKVRLTQQLARPCRCSSTLLQPSFDAQHHHPSFLPNKQPYPGHCARGCAPVRRHAARPRLRLLEREERP